MHPEAWSLDAATFLRAMIGRASRMGQSKRSTTGRSFRWVTPRQARSQSTMDRLLDATESLLRDRAFDDLTIAMICKAADSHVGSFYNIFKDKDALLECLLERVDRDRVATFTRALSHARDNAMTLEQRAAALVGSAVRIAATRPGALRAWNYARRHPGFTWKNARESNAAVIDAICQLFLDCRNRIGHPTPRQAIEFALVANQETVTRFLIDRHTLPPGAARMSRAALTESLIAMFLANLRASPN